MAVSGVPQFPLPCQAGRYEQVAADTTGRLTGRARRSSNLPVNRGACRGDCVYSEHMFESLNPEQREAVTHRGAPLLVVAGAGSGKTLTLAGRVAHLLCGGAPPERILLLTFSRRAAREMLGRAERLTGRDVLGK